MIVEMEMLPESLRLVKSSPRVMRFLGGTDPVPLSKREVDRIVSQMTGEISLAKASEDFIVGREVEISDGPFAGFVGMIEKVDAEGEKLTIMVSIFGRMTPVELGFHQVKR
jgi:transcriptional antiterminator NusG